MERCGDAGERHQRRLGGGSCRSSSWRSGRTLVGAEPGSAPVFGVAHGFVRWSSSWGVISQQPFGISSIPQGLAKALVPLALWSIGVKSPLLFPLHPLEMRRFYIHLFQR